MKLIAIASLLAAVVACERPESDASVAARTLGGDAICLPLGDSRLSVEISCVARGVRYLCVVAGARANCAAQTLPAPAERPR